VDTAGALRLPWTGDNGPATAAQVTVQSASQTARRSAPPSVSRSSWSQPHRARRAGGAAMERTRGTDRDAGREERTFAVLVMTVTSAVTGSKPFTGYTMDVAP
jgi:hypothetical protein